MSLRSTLAAALLAALPAAHANLLTNASFEAGSFTGGSYGFPLAMQLFPGSSAITGWAIGGEAAWFLPGQAQLSPSDGQYALDLTGFCDLGMHGTQPCGGVGAGGYGSVSQTLATVVGATYRITVDGGTYGLQAAAPTLVVSAGSTSQGFTLPAGGPSTGLWQTYTMDFTATGASTLVTFGGSGGAFGQTYYLGVDNAQVDLLSLPVPEPASGALLLAGLAAVGTLVRRRTAAPAPARR